MDPETVLRMLAETRADALFMTSHLPFRAETIARVMATKKVSPKGLGSGIRMVQFYINRAGKNLSPERREVLEKAKRLLQDRARKQKARSAK